MSADAPTSLAELDAVGTARLIADGVVSAREVADAALRRIEQVDPALNALSTLTPEVAERQLSALPGEPAGPLAGVPFLMKDAVATVAGVRHTEGSAFLRDYVAPADSEYVARLKRAGVVILGTTTPSEFMIKSTAETELLGTTRNPWDLRLSTGGSSAGSGAAVAARMVPAAHGGDAGGSIRIPASCCGLFGFKPSRGLNPLGPAFGDVWSGLFTEHVLTRSVRDSAAFLDATAGPAQGDPYPAPAAGGFLDGLRSPGARLRIACWPRRLDGRAVSRECEDAALRTAELCTRLGHTVEESCPALDFEEVERSFFLAVAAGCAWLVDHWAGVVGRAPAEGEVDPFIAALVAAGRDGTAADYLTAVERMQRAGRRVAEFLSSYDVLLTPTLGASHVPLGYFDASADDPLAVLDRDGEFSPFTWLANAVGVPAMSVPTWWSDEGLPVGAHVLGPMGSDGALLRLAAELEGAVDWQRRAPEVAAV